MSAQSDSTAEPLRLYRLIACPGQEDDLLALAEVQEEFGTWLCWPGLSGTSYALHIPAWQRSRKLDVITASSPADLRARLRAAEGLTCTRVGANPEPDPSGTALASWYGRLAACCQHSRRRPVLRCGPPKTLATPDSIALLSRRQAL